MPIARFQMPDGRIARFEVPEGTTPEQAQQIGQDFAAQQPAQGEEFPEVPQSVGLGAVANPQPGDPQTPQEQSFSPMNIAGEFAAGTNEAVLQLVDFLGPDQFNAAAQLFGSDIRVPTLAESEFGRAVGTGGFVPEGTAQRALRGAGAVVPAAVGGGAALRQAASAIPTTVSAVESTAPALLRQLGSGTAAADVGFGAASGAGAEIGREGFGETGAVAGSILAPLGAAGLKTAFNAGARGIQSLMASVSNMSDDGAATLLANAMIREGIGPEDAAARLAQLGPDALPSDLGTSFGRLLRDASNKIPRIEGQAATKLKARQSGQAQRVTDALDDATGTPLLNVDDEIARLSAAEGPRITRLYDEVRQQPLESSAKLKALLEGDNSVGRASKAAEARLNDRRAAGDTIGEIDVIDATKQELDDQIGAALRTGENNRVRDLVRLKNVMIDEVDIAVPQYKQARDAFAGKAQLENAADAGANFFKMKPRDVEGFVKSMGDSEKRMFKLGAKQALIDKLDAKQVSRDAVKALFGKGGDMRKLRALFDTSQQFKAFSDTLEREANFVLTRRAAQANSTTAKQIFDEQASSTALNDASAILGDPLAGANAIQRILGGIGAKKGSAANIEALEKAGDILLQSGMNPDKLAALLRRGSAEQVKRAIDNAIKKAPTARAIQPITIGAAAQALGSDNRISRQQ